MLGSLDAQTEEEAFFDRYFPSGTSLKSEDNQYKMDIDDRATKQQRREADGQKGHPARDSRGKGRSDRPDPVKARGEPSRDRGRRGGSRRRLDKDQEHENSDLHDAITSLQRLVLRHEDSISMVQAEYSFVAFLRLNTASSVVPALFDAQKA